MNACTQMMLKKVTIRVLVFAILVSFHNGAIHGKCILFLDTVAALSDKLQDLQDCKLALILHAWEKMSHFLAHLRTPV